MNSIKAGFHVFKIHINDKLSSERNDGVTSATPYHPPSPLPYKKKDFRCLWIQINNKLSSERDRFPTWDQTLVESRILFHVLRLCNIFYDKTGSYFVHF